jgi:hypothetical protein
LKGFPLSEWTHYRARVAALSRVRPPDDSELLEARRLLDQARPGLRATRDVYIQRLVDSAPLLTDEQRDRIAALLRPSGGSNAA